MAQNNSVVYKIVEENGLFSIKKNRTLLKTPHKTVFKTPYKKIAEQMIEDLESMGPESYITPYSSLCYAFTYDNIIHNNWAEEIRNELSNVPYEMDETFRRGTVGLPPARVVWDHIFYSENRPDEVREWIKTLNPMQLSVALTIYQSTGNMNLAYVFGHLIIDEGDEGYLTDLENLYGNSWADFMLSDSDIDRLFYLFSLFYNIR